MCLALGCENNSLSRQLPELEKWNRKQALLCCVVFAQGHGLSLMGVFVLSKVDIAN